jgi:predicted HAD superfamily Cof-like phosphohydrolase
MTPEEEIAELRKQLAHREAQVKDLQERGTQLVEEKRRVDRRMQILTFARIAGSGKGGQHVAETPSVPDEETVRFRMRLNLEEFRELFESVFGRTYDSRWAAIEEVLELGDITVNMPVFADSIGDLEYVLAGCAVAFGIDMAPIAWAIHEANMAKAAGPRRESDGKLLKPPGWKPPDVEGKLREQGWDPEGGRPINPNPSNGPWSAPHIDDPKDDIR